MKNERYTIVFPIWGLYDTSPSGFYHDPEKMMEEIAERGFNCVRLDDGAGLMHDFSGRRKGPAEIGTCFGKYDTVVRQSDCIGGDGFCDLYSRLISIAKAAKKYGVKLILSSWYYMHTYYYVREKGLNDQMYAIPRHERFTVFARFLDYILKELEDAGLKDVIAFAEIHNETNGLPFYYQSKDRTEKEEFVKEQNDAFIWLKSRHPEIDFAYDCYIPGTQPFEVPRDIQYLNVHNYFVWDVYDRLKKEDVKKYYQKDAVTVEMLDAYRSEQGLREVDSPDVTAGAALYNNLDPKYKSVFCDLLEEEITANMDRYRTKLKNRVEFIKEMAKSCPGAKIVSGEGVSYCGPKWLTWEENSERYWELVKFMMDEYKAAGFSGTIIKTCMGPEDPSWNMCKDRIIELNRRFLTD